MRIIVPFPPPGPTDVTARLLGTRLAELTGQQFIVENRSGAGTIIGTELVAKSPPDGHTLLLVTVQIAINPSIYAKLPYDTTNDLVPITQLTTQPYLLVAHPSVPARTVKDVIALARAHPDGMRCASSGIGGGNHLACELFNKMAGTKITHVPYKGAAPALIDTLAGHVEIYMPTPLTAFQHVRTGKLRAIAFTGTRRVAAMPELPTIAETLPGFEAGVWMGIFAPAATPRDTVRRIQQETTRVLQIADVRKGLTTEGGDVIASTSEEFQAFFRTELRKWAEIVRFSGARAE